MKTLQDYSEDIYKCSKCGLCQSVCPVFEATGLETAVSRGKFMLLHGVLSGKLELTDNLSKYLDLCLGCKACYDFCPSSISADDIITAARSYAYKINGGSFIKNFIVSNFSSNFRLSLLKIMLNIYKYSGIINITDFLAMKFGKPGKLLSLFNIQVKEGIKYKKLTSTRSVAGLKIVYFPGCINNYVNDSVKNAVRIVLEKNGINLTIPDFSCCGIPARSSGNTDRFIELAKKNLDKIDPDIDYLITDCASCGSVWKLYENILDGEYSEKAKIIASKSININKFLHIQNVPIPEGINNKKVTYHDPCHLKRFQGVFNEPREILQKMFGVNYVEMEEADKCCGASGTFCVNNHEISRKISAKKAENILNTNADIVATSCPSCKIGISQGLLEYNRKIPVMQPVEILAELYLK